VSVPRRDAQGRFTLHDHPWRLTAVPLTSCREIRNMHSDYGYYDLYLSKTLEVPCRSSAEEKVLWSA
jgi:hypothetical protein